MKPFKSGSAGAAVVAYLNTRPLSETLTVAEVAERLQRPKGTISSALIEAARRGLIRASERTNHKAYSRMPDERDRAQEDDPYYWITNRVPPERWHEGVKWK